MNNTKAYQLIKAISPGDRTKVWHILSAGPEGEKKMTCRLFHLIHRHPRNGSDDALLDKKEVWESLYPAKSYRDSTLRKLCTDLVRELEAAFSHLYIERNDKVRMLLYLQYLDDQNFDPAFLNTEIRKTRRKLSKREIVSGEEYFENYKIEEMEYNHQFLHHSAWSKSNIDRMNRSLNSFFILEKLRLALSVFSRQKYIQFEKELPFLQIIFTMVDSGLFDDEPLIRLYYYAVRSYQEDFGNEMYYRLKSGLEEHQSTLHRERLRELCTIALSYCIDKVNHNQPGFYREALTWYQMMIRNDILMDQDYLTATTFRNIVLLAIRLNEFDWATKFVEKYTQYLEPEIQESTRMLSMGQILFNKKEFDQVIEHLMNVDYINVSYNLQSKLILAATYYELQEYEVLDNFLSSFGTYLRRKKGEISKGKYHRHQRFISMLNQMIRIPQDNKSKWQEIRTELTGKPEIVSYQWLLEKAESRINPV